MATEDIEGAWFQALQPAVGEQLPAETTRPPRRRIRARGAARARAEASCAAKRTTRESAAGGRVTTRAGGAADRGAEAAALAAAPPLMAQAMELMEMAAYDEQPKSAAPRGAAAADPHKRRAVAAGKAVGEAVGVGGNRPQ
eukprot:5586484-Prymnesium_polylepis.1